MSTRPASANRARRTPRGSATATTDARSGWRRAHRAYPGTVRTCPDDDHRNRCYISNPSPQAGPITSGYRIGNRCRPAARRPAWPVVRAGNRRWARRAFSMDPIPASVMPSVTLALSNPGLRAVSTPAPGSK